ncbi:MAG: hypothetical protein A3C93_05490 [Candidatus Lloydbacteria bacterium RIFCSPHIGHO2_02_FULL_54_17]|uniref:malate dehydrogenase (quinone) n=1 Tax=Candidatus Lloydbacteria bacterium RIFCSPHIGHO2_02_FULL_54_17 TaxID=1798664 RepID=A0A1G2DA86_9BACT|nr:MAG: hypothetical protein A2762_02910 [Candidatus Lloydbacteria bacterium RIFCSPHIGHO2_01_FULL_54_11]OGZ10534.1 MAG: hypothetical protein A3C93_05490 [Candidatus Lloydbacteria bacterium RIFCSPHIGHO2_02_FULL_54_17]OGZ15525.1 MAG: hypothetical protein A2948_04675 [Candidatus Lloydbacteria bacterium RIFCSPLOWO2_01_FULL_54_18]OGZ16896.1 MAG: hypothetical protein A3H76_05230 [Candidatus Lloydbacteria bacterium RIFCSPLOWO2_02_FULL_54_12]
MSPSRKTFATRATSFALLAMTREDIRDAVVIGAGVSGAADLLTLSFTNMERVALLERHTGAGMENSHPLYNAQTSHDGSTETNYDIPHALEVKADAELLRALLKKVNDPQLWQKRMRMALALGEEQVQRLAARYEALKEHYPLSFVTDRAEIEKIEPKLVLGRDPSEKIAILVSKDGFIVNYMLLAQRMISLALSRKPGFEVCYNTEVAGVERIAIEGVDGPLYLVKTKKRQFVTRAIFCAAGTYSLDYAQSMGYGTNLGAVMLGGSFLSAGNQVRGKVYPMQEEGLSFAEMHIDPDILDMRDSRVGPTIEFCLWMRARMLRTFPDFVRINLRSPWRMLKSTISILFANKLLAFVALHLSYRIPILGKWLVLRKAQRIIPTLRYRDLTWRRNAGGIRPQIVDLSTKKLIMGSVTITGEENGEPLIYNSTPSPGASISVANGVRDVETMLRVLDGRYVFDKTSFLRSIGIDCSIAPAPSDEKAA